jgi:hypothetical protein
MNTYFNIIPNELIDIIITKINILSSLYNMFDFFKLINMNNIYSMNISNPEISKKWFNLFRLKYENSFNLDNSDYIYLRTIYSFGNIKLNRLFKNTYIDLYEQDLNKFYYFKYCDSRVDGSFIESVKSSELLLYYCNFVNLYPKFKKYLHKLNLNEEYKDLFINNALDLILILIEFDDINNYYDSLKNNDNIYVKNIYDFLYKGEPIKELFNFEEIPFVKYKEKNQSKLGYLLTCIISIDIPYFEKYDNYNNIVNVITYDNIIINQLIKTSRLNYNNTKCILIISTSKENIINKLKDFVKIGKVEIDPMIFNFINRSETNYILQSIYQVMQNMIFKYLIEYNNDKLYQLFKSISSITYAEYDVLARFIDYLLSI